MEALCSLTLKNSAEALLGYKAIAQHWVFIFSLLHSVSELCPMYIIK